MSLVLSLQIPDGLVIAGDSLSTMQGNLQIQADVDTDCPQCGAAVNQRLNIQGPPIPTTTFSYAQKIFPFMEEFGVGTFGASQVGGKTMYFAVRELEQELLEDDHDHPMDTVTNAAQRIGDRAHELLSEQDDNLENRPDDHFEVGFQVVGYSENDPEIVEVKVGKNVERNKKDEITASGTHYIVESLHDAWGGRDAMPAFEAFSLQDAINYAKFMIRTTAEHQEFSPKMANVGGEIDIGLITPFNGFQWIQQKDLSQTLEQVR